MKLICLLVLSFSSFLTYGHRLEYEPVEFLVGSSKCFVLDTNSSNQSKPWVWYAPTLPAHPDPSHSWYIDKLLEKGISFAGCDQGEVRGSPKSVDRFTKFYKEMVDRGYSKQPVLLGQSRGGLMMLSWAVQNPIKVKAFAGIYPVLNLRSWPITRNLITTLADFEIDQDTFLKTVDLHNPIHQLEALARAKVPLYMVHGDSDRIVPLEENTQIVINRYTKLGGEAEVKVVPGKGHQVVDDFFKSKELIEFIIQQSTN
jgi:alpha-beta hydrolase superfamily lysophospholipase